jgi:hypothetical protein
MARDHKDDDGRRIIPLGEMRDYEVAEGHPDVRGWRVDSTDGVEIGRVHELLVDVDGMRTRYLDVRLTHEIAATPGDRDVLVPIGAARLDATADVVVLPLHAERVGLLPPYDHGPLTRSHEYEVMRHFSLGEAAAYDDQRFYSSRGQPARELREPASTAPRDIRVDDTGVRIPVAPEESVVLKRGEGGQDEVIIRRPIDKDESAR